MNKQKQTPKSQKALFMPKHSDLRKIVDGYKAAGLKIVLTNGVFDLVHIGHAMYTEKAKSFGDVLIVGVETDAVVRKDKGPDRPIVSQEERAEMMRFLGHIDIVTWNKVGGSRDLIRIVRPDFLVISESTKANAEAFKRMIKKKHGKYCGEVIILPPQAVTSTTARVRKLMVGGAKDLAQKIEKLFQEHLHPKT